MNWSMMTCAPLAKSPNCASQSTRASRPLDAVAVLEAEHRELGERAVAGLERRLLRVEGRERGPGVAGLGVVTARVALREGAAARVLAADADRRALEQQRAERERLGRAPVERQRALGHLRAAGELLDHLRVQVEARRHGRQHAADARERLARRRRSRISAAAPSAGAARGGAAAAAAAPPAWPRRGPPRIRRAAAPRAPRPRPPSGRRRGRAGARRASRTPGCASIARYMSGCV